MTPEETARELINKFRRITDEKGLRAIKLEYAKQCALIAVDEIIKSSPYYPSLALELMPHFRALKYWQEVKQEIEKL